MINGLERVALEKEKVELALLKVLRVLLGVARKDKIRINE